MNNLNITKYAKFIIWCSIVICSLNSIFNLLLANLITTYFESETISDETYIYIYNLLDSVFTILGLFYLIIVFTSFVLLSKWFYTSCKLNHLNGMKGLNTSPRWAWLWYAIPIAALFKPYQSLEETYQASTQRDDWKEISVPWVFPIWWLSWLFSNAASNYSFRLFSNLTEDSPYQDYVTEHYVAFTGEFLWVVSAIALLQIVKTVSANQGKLNFDKSYTKTKWKVS